MAVDLDDLSVLRCLLTKWLNIALILQVCVFGFKGITYFDALVIDLEKNAVFFLWYDVTWLINKYDDDDDDVSKLHANVILLNQLALKSN